MCVLCFILFYIFPFLLFEQAWQAGDKPLCLQSILRLAVKNKNAGRGEGLSELEMH